MYTDRLTYNKRPIDTVTGSSKVSLDSCAAGPDAPTVTTPRRSCLLWNLRVDTQPLAARIQRTQDRRQPAICHTLRVPLRLPDAALTRAAHGWLPLPLWGSDGGEAPAAAQGGNIMKHEQGPRSRDDFGHGWSEGALADLLLAMRVEDALARVEDAQFLVDQYDVTAMSDAAHDLYVRLDRFLQQFGRALPPPVHQHLSVATGLAVAIMNGPSE